MDAAICPTVAIGSTTSFGQVHFGGCRFGDKRLTNRAVISGDALMRHPGGTLPGKLPRAEWEYKTGTQLYIKQLRPLLHSLCKMDTLRISDTASLAANDKWCVQ
jgi:hypothetical protein